MPRSNVVKSAKKAPRKKSGDKGVFFNSLPKSGKNLIYTFFSALGFERVSMDESFNASIHDLVYADQDGIIVFSLERALSGAPTDFSPAKEASAAIGTLRARQIAQKHLPFLAPVADALTDAGRRSIFVWRDPRDVLVSMLNYARSQSKPDHLAKRLADLDDDDALISLLEGRGDLIPFADYVDGFLGWIGRPGVLTVCFEDLVGPEGGGTAERQRRTFEEICAHLGVEADPAQIAYAARAAFNRRAGTFYKGRTGAWRDQFSPKVAEAFNIHAGRLLSRWRIWRLERLETYTSDVDERYAIMDERHTAAEADTKALESQLQAVAATVRSGPGDLDEPLAKTVSRRISALEARSKTAERRLQGVMARLDAAADEYKALELEFTKRAEATNELRAEFVKVSQIAKLEGELVSLANKLELDADRPLPALKQEVDRLRAELANAKTLLADWMKHGKTLEATKVKLEDELRLLQTKGEAARKELLRRLEERDGQMTALETSLAGSAERSAAQTKAFEALLDAAKSENKTVSDRVEQRNATIESLKERLAKTEKERRSLLDAFKDAGERNAAQTQALQSMLQAAKSENEDINQRVEQRNETLKDLRERLAKTEKERRNLLAALKDAGERNAAQTQALQSMLQAAKNENKELNQRVEQRNETLKDLKERLAKTEKERRNLLDTLKEAGERNGARVDAFKDLLKKAQADIEAVRAQVVRQSEKANALQQMLASSETERRAMAARLAEIAASSNATRDQLVSIVGKKEAEARTLNEELRATQQHLKSTTESLIEAQIGLDIRRELESAATKMEIDVSGGSPAAALTAAAESARAALEAQINENGALRQRLDIAQASEADLKARLQAGASPQSGTGDRVGDPDQDAKGLPLRT
ncbi:MAG: sulfotransferase domain-containing protein [Oceanicaulis sp.]